MISAIGHEIDTTLSDLVADVRALTPSEAAERMVPDRTEIFNLLATANQRMRTGLMARMDMARARLESLATRPIITRPLETIHRVGMQLDELDSRCNRALQTRIDRSRNSLTGLAARIEAINPLAVLARGYSLTTAIDGQVISQTNQISAGDQIVTRLADGALISRVEQVESKGNAGNSAAARKPAAKSAVKSKPKKAAKKVTAKKSPNHSADKKTKK